MVKVYGLRAPALSEEIRYVGITTQGDLKRRLAQHWSRVRRKAERTHKAAWMRKVDAMGLSVEIVLLDEVPESEWQQAERRYIAQYPNLTNSTSGGEGLLNPTPETRERMRQAQLGRKHSPERVEKARARMLGNKYGLGVKQSPEHIAKAVAGRIGKSGRHERTPEIRANMSAAKIGSKHSEETRRKMSETHRRLLRDPVRIEKIRQAHLGTKHTEETKQKMREAALGRAVSEETRARMRDAAQRRWASVKAVKAVGAQHG